MVIHLSAAQALRAATPLPLDLAVVEDSIDSMGDQPDHVRVAEAVFRRVLRDGLGAVPRAERYGLAAATGHIVESAVEVLLADLGWHPVGDSDQPLSAGHGVDLVMMDPDCARVFVIEVKGTLQRRRWPRLSTALPRQLSEEWLDKDDNPGMRAQELRGADVSGLVVAVQLPTLRWRSAISADLAAYHPVSGAEQLEDVDWVFEPGQA